MPYYGHGILNSSIDSPKGKRARDFRQRRIGGVLTVVASDRVATCIGLPRKCMHWNATLGLTASQTCPARIAGNVIRPPPSMRLTTISALIKDSASDRRREFIKVLRLLESCKPKELDLAVGSSLVARRRQFSCFLRSRFDYRAPYSQAACRPSLPVRNLRRLHGFGLASF